MMITVKWSDLPGELKQRINLKKLVQCYTELTAVNDHEWTGRCPHPDHKDKNPSFRLYREKDGSFSFWCFGCHNNGFLNKKGNKHYGTDCIDFIRWMSDYEGSDNVLSFSAAVKELAQQVDITIQQDLISENPEIKKLLESNKKIASDAHTRLLTHQAALQYLYNRGLDNSDINKWNLGIAYYQENQSQSIQRITFPLYDTKSDIIGFISRAMPMINYNGPKYKNSSASAIFKKSTYFYGEHLLQYSSKRVIIVEGPLDVILAIKYGLSNVIATLGTSFTGSHLSFLKEKGLIPVIAYDGDSAGQKATKNAVITCQEAGVPVNVYTLPVDQDMADIALTLKGDLYNTVEKSIIPGWRFLLDNALTLYDAGISKLKQKIMSDIIAATPSNREDKILMTSFVKERLGITL